MIKAVVAVLILTVTGSAYCLEPLTPTLSYSKPNAYEFKVEPSNTEPQNINATENKEKPVQIIQKLVSQDSKDVMAFQTFAESTKIETPNSQIELYNLNPWINKWFILKTHNSNTQIFHLENVLAENSLILSTSGIIIRDTKTNIEKECVLWDAKNDIRKLNLNTYKNPYYPICEGLIYVRLNRSSTTELSSTEWMTEKLRKISFGEDLINFVKPLIVARQAEAAGQRDVASSPKDLEVKDLLGASIKVTNNTTPVAVNHHLGISLKLNEPYLRYGQWYKIGAHEDIYVSLMLPGLVDTDLIKEFPRETTQIQESEKDKLIYLTSYDLSKFGISYVNGTDYPGVGRSPFDKSQKQVVENLNPLVMVGSVPPYKLNDTVGVFIGGYKRSHSFFKYGKHQGKYYGYIENGVVISPLEAGLATFYATKNGEIDIIKWPDNKTEQESLLKEIVSARQNGILIVDSYKPGESLLSWGNGNWSGDVNGNLKTLRSAVCIQKNNGKKHLIFAAFTAATPNTMAHVFRAYKCENAMQLDMNAYMYLHNAIISYDENHNVKAEYLHTEMEYPKGIKKPRFVMDNNNRDFFYVYKKN